MVLAFLHFHGVIEGSVPILKTLPTKLPSSRDIGKLTIVWIQASSLTRGRKYVFVLNLTLVPSAQV